ncbi:MAG: hypothetical protein ACTSW4_07930 [Candidatus Ranarchaeia archaeon]
MLQTFLIPGSEVPLLALVSEGFALLVYLYLSVKVLKKWRERKRKAALNLFLSFGFYVVAITALFSTKTSDFVSGGILDLATLGVNLGYLFSALGNVFLFYFTENIFYEKPVPYLREFITFANGVTAGFLFIFIFQLQGFPFLEIPGTYISAHLLIWHVIVSTLGFSILTYSAFRESRYPIDSLSRTSFRMIGLSGVFEILVFVFFFADRFVEGGYTLWYFLAWLSASAAGFCSMTGFLRPEWFKRLVFGRPR